MIKQLMHDPRYSRPRAAVANNMLSLRCGPSIRTFAATAKSGDSRTHSVRDNADLGKVLHWAHNRGLHTLALCHGPAALLAAKSDAGFLYDGYKISVFADAVDRQTPMIGYLPGPMPWWVCERLNALGVETINKKADSSTHVDRRLVTGASPQAANTFGRLAAETLLKRTDVNS